MMVFFPTPMQKCASTFKHLWIGCAQSWLDGHATQEGVQKVSEEPSILTLSSWLVEITGAAAGSLSEQASFRQSTPKRIIDGTEGGCLASDSTSSR